MTDPQRTDRRRSPAILAVALVVPVALLVYAVSFFASIDDLRLNSRAYPQGLITVLVVLLAAQIAADLRAWWRGSAQHDRSLRDLWGQWHRTVYTVGLTALFAFAIERVGFYEAMIPYTAVLLPCIGVRRPLFVMLYTAGALLVIYGLFTVVLGVRLPQGALGL